MKTTSLMGDGIVLSALGVQSQGAMASMMIRRALEAGDTLPFSMATWVFRATLPLAAVVKMTSLFKGRVLASPGVWEEPTEHPGFYRTRSKLFHPDSTDIEEAALEAVIAGRARAQASREEGVNISQSMEFYSMADRSRTIVHGSILDFHDLRTALGRRFDPHPELLEAVNEWWAELTEAYPLTAQAINEVQP